MEERLSSIDSIVYPETDYFFIVLQSPATEPLNKENNLNKVEEVKKGEEVPAKKPQVEEKPIQVSSNAFASGSSTNSFNVITDRPTSRVLAPPGGHCSIRLG
jgi:hypothetical protein